MKMNYLRDIFLLALYIFVGSLLVFILLSLFVSIESIEMKLRVQIVLYTTIIVTIFVSMINLRWYLIKVCNRGIKAPFRSVVNWSDISSIKVRGIFSSYKMKRIVFETENDKIEIKLFPYQSPESLCDFIKKELPWAAEADFTKASFDIKKL